MSFRGGSRVVTLGRGHKHRDKHGCLRKASHPFPEHPHHPTPTPGPRSAPPSEVSPKKLTEERTDKGNMPEGNKTCDQIKFCVPSLLKEKWRNKIQ